MGRGFRNESSFSSGSGSPPKVRKRPSSSRDRELAKRDQSHFEVNEKHYSTPSPKRRNHYEENYSDDDYYQEPNEVEKFVKRENVSGHSPVNKSGVSPSSMIKLCEKLLEMLENKRLPETLQHSVYNVKSLQSVTRDNEDCFDREDRHALINFKSFYDAASRNISFIDAVKRVKSFIEDDPSTVTLHPKFPTKSANASQVYLRRMQAKGVRMSATEARAKLDSDPTDPDVTAAINEFNEEYENYGERIKEFREEEKRSIMPHQITYLNKMIRTHETRVQSKKSKKSDGVDKPRGRKIGKTSDGFSVFSESMKKRYTNLNETERFRKLKADYDNLTEDQRNLLENMANK